MGVISIMQQAFDHHGCCELENVDLFIWFCNVSGAIGGGHEELEANPRAGKSR